MVLKEIREKIDLNNKKILELQEGQMEMKETCIKISKYLKKAEKAANIEHYKVSSTN